MCRNRMVGEAGQPEKSGTNTDGGWEAEDHCSRAKDARAGSGGTGIRRGQQASSRGTRQSREQEKCGRGSARCGSLHEAIYSSPVILGSGCRQRATLPQPPRPPQPHPRGQEYHALTPCRSQIQLWRQGKGAGKGVTHLIPTSLPAQSRGRPDMGKREARFSLGVNG